jgi:hypothetical protein
MAPAVDPVTAKYSVSFTQSANVDAGSILMVTARIVRQSTNPHFKRFLENTMPPPVIGRGRLGKVQRKRKAARNWFPRLRAQRAELWAF